MAIRKVIAGAIAFGVMGFVYPFPANIALAETVTKSNYFDNCDRSQAWKHATKAQQHKAKRAYFANADGQGNKQDLRHSFMGFVGNDKLDKHMVAGLKVWVFPRKGRDALFAAASESCFE